MLHPGEMGAALVAGLRSGERGDTEVVWAADGRSSATRSRAEQAGLVDAGSVAALAGRVDLVVSICPPDAALATARHVADAGFAGTFLDANAISPATAAGVAAVVEEAGAVYVDGSVIGGPGAPRLYLAGDGAAALRSLFGTPVEALVLDGGGPFAASALKMVYAGWTKATTALLFALAAAAEQLGVADALRAEWEHSQPSLPARLEMSARSGRKAWRWGREMDEIARTLAAAGLPGDFHAGAADVFDRLAALKGADDIAVDEVVGRLLASSAPGVGGEVDPLGDRRATHGGDGQFDHP